MSEELKPDTIDDEFRREMTKLMLERYNIQFEMELNEYRKNRIIYKALGFEKKGSLNINNDADLIVFNLPDTVKIENFVEK